jgi:anti-sigma factor RsiW
MNASNNQCPKERVAAYLDGMLDAEAVQLFEQHLYDCTFCNAELNEQRRFILALDSALAVTSNLPLPQNFIRIVTARAESDLSGLRDRLEHKRAARFCLILACAGFALIGVAAGKGILLSVRTTAAQTFGMFSLLWTALRDATVGLTVVSRVLGGGLVPEPHFAGLVALLLVLALVLLFLLIERYHRHHDMRLANDSRVAGV